MAEVYLTKEGKVEKQKHLEYLKAVRRPEVAEKIKIAREFGDLSENAEYDAARAEQAQLEQEIAVIEETLRIAKVVDTNKRKTDTIGVGSVVEVLDIEFDETMKFTITGSLESKPTEGIISNASPIGGALMGKKKGDIVQAKTPGGMIKLKVVSIA